MISRIFSPLSNTQRTRGTSVNPALISSTLTPDRIVPTSFEPVLIGPISHTRSSTRRSFSLLLALLMPDAAVTSSR